MSESSIPSKKRPADPFADLTLSSHQVLRTAERITCTGTCGKTRRYYCSDCVIPLVTPAQAVPKLVLPLRIEILQSHAEVPQRSTAQHVPILAPGYAHVWRPFPQGTPDFQKQVLDHSDGTVAILYPGEGALTPEQAYKSLPNLKSLIVIDASWTKSVTLISHPCLAGLPRVTLPEGRASRFWRYAPKRGEHSENFSPDKVGHLVSTVEAVHRFCDAYGRASGSSRCFDDLLWFFAFQHGRVRDVYENAPGKRQRIMRKSKGMLADF